VYSENHLQLKKNRKLNISSVQIAGYYV